MQRNGHPRSSRRRSRAPRNTDGGHARSSARRTRRGRDGRCAPCRGGIIVVGSAQRGTDGGRHGGRRQAAGRIRKLLAANEKVDEGSRRAGARPGLGGSSGHGRRVGRGRGLSRADGISTTRTATLCFTLHVITSRGDDCHF